MVVYIGMMFLRVLLLAHLGCQGCAVKRCIEIVDADAFGASPRFVLQLLNSNILAFCVAGPRVWNSLSSSTQSAPSLLVFRRLLKCELFRRCYDLC